MPKLRTVVAIVGTLAGIGLLAWASVEEDEMDEKLRKLTDLRARMDLALDLKDPAMFAQVLKEGYTHG